MTTNTYPLGTMVSFLESMLTAFGHAQPSAGESTRSALRKRLRELTRLSERLLKREPSDAPPLFTSDIENGANCNSSLLLQGSYATSTRLVRVPVDVCDIDEVIVGWETPPFLGDVRTTRLDVALRIDRDGRASFFESVMAYWARRHDVADKASSSDKRPRRRRALDRLFLALMRFVFGFFGSHKVDARNNP